MKPRASLTILALLGAFLAACDGDSNSGDEAADTGPETTAEATPTEEPKEGGGQQQSGGDRGNAAKLTALTKAELERARGRARVLAQCLRTSGAEVSTDSNSPKSRVIKAGKGVVLRVTWDNDNGADVYVGGKRRNTRRTARALKREPAMYKKRILVLYDGEPSGEQAEMIKQCVSRDTV